MAISFQQIRTIEAVQQGEDSRSTINGFVHEGTGYAYLQYDEGAPFAGVLLPRQGVNLPQILVDYNDFIVKINGKIDTVTNAEGLLTKYGHAA